MVASDVGATSGILSVPAVLGSAVSHVEVVVYTLSPYDSTAETPILYYGNKSKLILDLQHWRLTSLLWLHCVLYCADGQIPQLTKQLLEL